jgi:hypothetical protein
MRPRTAGGAHKNRSVLCMLAKGAALSPVVNRSMPDSEV